MKGVAKTDSFDLKVVLSAMYRIWRVCKIKPEWRWKHHLFLACYLFFALTNAVLHVFFAFLLVKMFSVVESDKSGEFVYWCILILLYNVLNAMSKTVSNYFSMRLCVIWRINLTQKLHQIYVDDHCRLYYTLNVVDTRVDNIDQRITYDVDQMTQFLTDFFLGGIHKPDAGFVNQLLIFLATSGLLFSLHFFYNWEGDNLLKTVSVAVATSLAIFLAMLVPCFFACRNLILKHIELQNSEAEYRITHSKTKINAETVAFYGAGTTELHFVNKQFGKIISGMRAYRGSKFFLDVIMLISLQVANTGSRLLSAQVKQINGVFLLNDLFKKLFESLMEINQSLLDFTAGTGFIFRVSNFIELSEMYLIQRRNTLQPVRNRLTGSSNLLFGSFTSNFYLSGEDPTWLAKEFPELEERDLMPFTLAQRVYLKNMYIYTPDRSRLLIPDLTLSLALDQSCLIMGPSGIGKSSIIRVLSGIWPCMTEPGVETMFERPPNNQLFFLSQTPFVEEMSLLENILYPVDDERIREETTSEDILAWSKLCNFEHIWLKYFEADEGSPVQLATILSLGEQQRLQFVRLMCHYSFFKRHNPYLDFLVLLDESTSAMDSDSEAMCYKAISGLNLGFISIAHRPTVIQYHDTVLRFKVEDGEITYTSVTGKRAAEAAAIGVTQYGRLSLNIYGEVPDDDDDENALLFPKHGLDALRNTRWKSLLDNRNLLEEEETEIYKALRQEFSESRVSNNDFRGVLTRIYQTVKHREQKRASILNNTPYETVLIPRSRKGGVFLQDLGRLGQLCLPNIFTPLFGTLLLAFSLIVLTAVLEGLLPFYQTEFTKEVTKEVAGGAHPLRKSIWLVGLTLLAAIIKAFGNRFSYSFFIGARNNLNNSIMEKYFDEKARIFYTMNHLDTLYDSVDQRLSYDAEQTLLYGTELVLGGILKPTSGLIYQLTIFMTAIYGVAKEDPTAETHSASAPFTSKGSRLILVLTTSAMLLVFVSFLIYMLAIKLSKAYEKQQKKEADFRYVHTKLRKDAESIAFFQGEKVAQEHLEGVFESCWRNSNILARTKLWVDALQMGFYYLALNAVNTIAGILYFTIDSATRLMMGETARATYFDKQNETLKKAFSAIMKLSKQILDFTKFQASLNRFSEAAERMDLIHEFVLSDNRDRIEMTELQPLKPRLTSDPIVQVVECDTIKFKHCNIGTPDGTQILVRDLTFQVLPGKSILIKGPSGMGKSSILRGLASLWPIYENKVGPKAELFSPPQSSLMLVAQKPYMASGSFREQFAYPVRDPRHLSELTDERLREILKLCYLNRFLTYTTEELDDPNIKLGMVLSLGEQQRVQFGRVFWHHWCSQLFGDATKGFYAILDESTSSMDVEAEAICYQNLRARNIGFLSISHRVTTVQFHDEVLEFYEDQDPNAKGLSYRIVRAYDVVQNIAAEILGE